MLEHISVRGFRSLREFELTIRPGLNILIGPNGAGKTNIILFFEFIRRLVGGDVSEAVSSLGGAGQVFTKLGRNSYSSVISAEISGSAKYGKVNFSYRYAFQIEASVSRQEIYFLSQSFEMRSKEDLLSDVSQAVDIIYRYNPAGSDIVTINSWNVEARQGWGFEDFRDMAECGLFAQRSFLWHLGYVSRMFGDVIADLTSRFLLNVVPSEVKKPEDSTRQPGIDSNGSGLSATLYAIKRRRPIFDTVMNGIYRPNRRVTPTWESVIERIRIGVPTIDDIEIENDTFDNLLRCRITVGRSKKKAVLPLSAMSDGTVKWMSLIARLSTSSGAMLLEEPENYLHPLMQREMVSLLRNSISNSGFMIVSSHSETFLDASTVEEIVVVEYTEEGTTARRLQNSEELAKEISRTGFGLGYYYMADAFEV